MNQDNSQPTSTPPAGGSWTWDAAQGWVETLPADSTPQPTDTDPE